MPIALNTRYNGQQLNGIQYRLRSFIIRRIGRGEYKKLFFTKENTHVLDDEELEKFRKKILFSPSVKTESPR